jgi:uncharacterized protein (DUF58 family)
MIIPEARGLCKGNVAGILSAMTGTLRLRKRSRLLPLLLGLLVVLQVITPSRAWTLLFVTLAGTLGISYVWARHHAERIRLSREQRYGWMHVGDLLEETFRLENSSPFPVLWIEVEDQSDLPGYTASSVRATGDRSTLSWRVEGTCTRRGLFTLGPWRARLSDPFGLFEVVHEFTETQSVLVYPPVVHLPSIQLPRGAATGAGRTSQRALELTTNAAGVRDYMRGDSLNRIHWRTTAHHEGLMVKEFDLEPSGDLWIVLDLQEAVQAGEGEESTEEYGVILAASLADRMLRENRAVGLVAYGEKRTFLLPQRGRAFQWRILQALATVHARGEWPLGRVLAEMDRNLGRGMTLAVITPSCEPEWLAALLPPMQRGIAPSAILLDPASFGGEGNVPALQGLLADLGVPSHVVAQGTPFRPVVEHKPVGRPEYKVLRGTGRVIAVER